MLNKNKIIKGVKIVLNYINPIRIISFFYINHQNREEITHPPFAIFNERPIEYRFVFEQISNQYPKKVLDVGTGVTSLPHLMANCGCKVTAADNIKDYWGFGQFFNRHYFIENDDITNTQLKEKFDLITCISTLEHIEKFDDAVSSMLSLLEDGGFLILTFPYTENEFIDNVYTKEGTSVTVVPKFKTHSYSRKELNKWINGKAEIVKQEYWKFFEGNFWTNGNKLSLPISVSKDENHQISCVLIQKHS